MLLWNLVKENRKALIFLVILGILMVSFSSAITFLAVKYEAEVQRFTAWNWVIVYSISCLTMAFALTPTTFVALVSGYFLGWTAIPGTLVSYVIASFFGFIISGYIDHGHFISSLNRYPQPKALLAGLQQRQFSFIVLSRLSPVFPFAMTNVVLAMVKVSFYQFLTAGFLGMLPRTLLFIWIGSQFREIREVFTEGSEHSMARIGFSVLLMITLAGFYFYFKSLINKTKIN